MRLWACKFTWCHSSQDTASHGKLCVPHLCCTPAHFQPHSPPYGQPRGQPAGCLAARSTGWLAGWQVNSFILLNLILQHIGEALQSSQLHLVALFVLVAALLGALLLVHGLASATPPENFWKLRTPLGSRSSETRFPAPLRSPPPNPSPPITFQKCARFEGIISPAGEAMAAALPSCTRTRHCKPHAVPVFIYSSLNRVSSPP